MKKKLMLIMVSLLCIISNITLTHASTQKTDEDYINGFKEIVEASDYYKDYESNIKDVFVAVINENEQITIAYNLDNSSDSNATLVFVGNKGFQFEQILLVNQNDNAAEVKDLLNGIRTRAHLGYCVEYTCSLSIPAAYVPQPGCSTIVGQACQPLQYLPSYSKILYLLCRGGVFVSCNITTDRTCLSHKKVEYECSIP